LVRPSHESAATAGHGADGLSEHARPIPEAAASPRPKVNSELLSGLLEQVSRSFYQTLRILPAAVRPQIGLAYLLARATDTIADTGLVPLEQRLAALRALRERILQQHHRRLEFGALAQHQSSPAERVLLERIEEALSLLEQFNPSDQRCIRDVLQIISSGQELDLVRFQGSSAQNIIPLRTEAELDDYTYRVAGCVGEFWTRVCRAHLFPDAPLDESQLLADALRFGKGLQLVNILRDLPADLRQGRCYLPSERLALLGLKPADLLAPSAEPKLRPLYRSYLRLARDHLAAGWNYTLALPRASGRVRLGCAWPLLFGVGTLNALATHNVLDASRRLKISRADLRRIMFGTLLRYPFPRWWAKLFAEAARPLALLD
jgi:farnesyl-diphosphate farnesyltransferase